MYIDFVWDFFVLSVSIKKNSFGLFLQQSFVLIQFRCACAFVCVFVHKIMRFSVFVNICILYQKKWWMCTWNYYWDILKKRLHTSTFLTPRQFVFHIILLCCFKLHSNIFFYFKISNLIVVVAHFFLLLLVVVIMNFCIWIRRLLFSCSYSRSFFLMILHAIHM